MKTIAGYVLTLLSLPILAWTRLLASNRAVITYGFILLSSLVAGFLYLLKNVDGVSHLLIAYLAFTLAVTIVASCKPHLFLMDLGKAASLKAGTGLERLSFGCQAALVVPPLTIIQLAVTMLVLAVIFPSFNHLDFIHKIIVAGGGTNLIAFLLYRLVGARPALTPAIAAA